MKIAWFVIAAAAMSAGTTADAKTYCCKINPAICIAVCGQACCSNDRLSAGGGNSNGMSKIPDADLRAELRSAGNGSPEVSAKLRAEIDRRKNTVGDIKTK